MSLNKASFKKRGLNKAALQDTVHTLLLSVDCGYDELMNLFLTINEEYVKRVEEFQRLQSIITECPECSSSIRDWMFDSLTTKEENNYLCAKCGYRYTETLEEQDKRDKKEKAAFKIFWADILR